MSYVLLIFLAYSSGQGGGAAIATDRLEMFSEQECNEAAEKARIELSKQFTRVVAYCVKRDLTGLRKAYD